MKIVVLGVLKRRDRESRGQVVPDHYYYIVPRGLEGYIAPAALQWYSGSTTGINFNYASGAVLKGLLTDDIGNPLSGFNVALDPGDQYYVDGYGYGAPKAKAITDASGHYTLAFNETSPGSTHVVEPFVHAGYTKLGPAFPGSYLTVTGLANGTTTM